MYDIVTLEPEDKDVMTAVNAIIDAEGAIPGTNGNYRFFVPGAVSVEGDGGANSHVLVVVAHGNVNSLSGHKSWADFQNSVPEGVDWANVTTIYIAACSVAGEDGTAFLNGNIANEVKAAFSNATVWASSSDVNSGTLAGDWHML
jgi:hypothetical protein